ncbi:hypothetical protein FW320_13265 [Azospirillum sp. Vi22]|uniref:hypothetical protein n=1 Tax=Azospirillum baldaniorum TaxID=1064539 RepID=UPI00157A47DE|nr:hypothetical protein [Azospirillum baldaniorum]NUB07140.1 hypothetical protein [Azospirillum baldaniorum]
MTDTPTAARTLPRVFTITGPTGTHALSSTLIHICNGLVHDGGSPAFILDHDEMSNAVQRLGLLVSHHVTFLAGFSVDELLNKTDITFDALLIGNAERLTADQFGAILSWATERGASRVFAANPPAVRTGEPTYGDTIHDLLLLLDPADPERYAAVMREIGAVALKAAGEPEVQTVSLKQEFDPRSMLQAVAKSLFGDDVPAPGEDVITEEMIEAIAFHLRLKATQIPAELVAGLATEPLTGPDGQPVEVKPLSFWTALRPARIEGADLDATVAGLEQGWTSGGTATLAGGPDTEIHVAALADGRFHLTLGRHSQFGHIDSIMSAAEAMTADPRGGVFSEPRAERLFDGSHMLRYVTLRRTGTSYTADTCPSCDSSRVGLLATTLGKALAFAREFLTTGQISGDPLIKPAPLQDVAAAERSGMAVFEQFGPRIHPRSERGEVSHDDPARACADDADLGLTFRREPNGVTTAV